MQFFLQLTPELYFLMNHGKVSSSFHPFPSLLKASFLFLNTGILLLIGVYRPSKQSPHDINGVQSLGSELASSELSNSSSGEIFFVLSCWKMTASSLNLSHSRNKYWFSVSVYFDEFCFPSKTSSDEPWRRSGSTDYHWATSKIFVKKTFFGAL